MVDRIYGLKNNFIELIGKKISDRGIERIDVQEMGMLVDMVKDLAEAEEKCWEAEYYKSVASAMEQSSGYSQGSMGYQQPSGYQNARMGYMRPSGHTELMKPLKEALRTASPEEREHIINELKALV